MYKIPRPLGLLLGFFQGRLAESGQNCPYHAHYSRRKTKGAVAGRRQQEYMQRAHGSARYLTQSYIWQIFRQSFIRMESTSLSWTFLAHTAIISISGTGFEAIVCTLGTRLRPAIPNRVGDVECTKDEKAPCGHAPRHGGRRKLQCQRSRRTNRAEAAHAVLKQARRFLKQATQDSKRKCFRKLCDAVEQDPWAGAFRLVVKRVCAGNRSPTDPESLNEIVRSLFPTDSAKEQTRYKRGPTWGISKVTEADVSQSADQESYGAGCSAQQCWRLSRHVCGTFFSPAQPTEGRCRVSYGTNSQDDRRVEK